MTREPEGRGERATYHCGGVAFSSSFVGTNDTVENRTRDKSIRGRRIGGRRDGAYAFLDMPRIRLPYFIRRKGTGMKRTARPPRREEAPGVPSLRNTEREWPMEKVSNLRTERRRGGELTLASEKRESGAERGTDDGVDGESRCRVHQISIDDVVEAS
jgi:hypothetical protein